MYTFLVDNKRWLFIFLLVLAVLNFLIVYINRNSAIFTLKQTANEEMGEEFPTDANRNQKAWPDAEYEQKYQKQNRNNKIAVMSPSNQRLGKATNTTKTSVASRSEHPCKRLLSNTFLICFMGSGSTWTQHLVNSAVCPGYQCNSKVQPEGFNKRYMDLLALRKCHHMIELCDHPGIEKIILLVRNPLDALVAYFNHKRVGRRSEVTDWSTDSRLWQKFLDGDKLDQWKNIYASHLTQNTTCTPKPHTKTYLLRYENLKNDLSGELRRLYEFLDVNISDNRFQEIMNDSEGCFHRKTSSKSVEKKSQNYSMNRFSPDKIKKLQRDEKLVNDLLKKYKVENYDG